MPGTLTVSLNTTRVGTINNIPGDYNIFAFDPEYAEDPKRPVLSQSLIDKNEDLIRIIPRTHTASPPFVANLLPETESLLIKLPTNSYARLPENEFAIMSLATAVKLDVPPIELRSVVSIPDALPYIAALRPDEDKVFAIKRFDRQTNGLRIHVEDFNQVAAQKPADKYEHRTSSYIAKVISQICEPADLDEFVRRLIFGICVGNDDMHLKNWALIYPDGIHPKIAPLYDFVFTRPYLPNGVLALTVGSKRRFADMTIDTLRAFAAQAEISEKRVGVLAAEMTEKIRSAWPQIKDTISDERFSTALEHHFDHVPIMNGSPRGGRHRSAARRLDRD
jgi:serine/threonine-protein kinase HipA